MIEWINYKTTHHQNIHQFKDQLFWPFSVLNKIIVYWKWIQSTSRVHLLPFFSVFFSLLFPLSLRRLSLERDLRGPPSFSSPGFPNSLTLSRSHSRSALAFSRRSISRSRSAHWSRSCRREGRPDARPRPEPGPCSSAPGLSAAPKPLWKSSYKTEILRLQMAKLCRCKRKQTDNNRVLPHPAGRSLL